jgi:hypothetical protein
LSELTPLRAQFQKRRPLDDVPGLKMDVDLTGRRAIIAIEACGHKMVFDDLTRENDIDRDSEKWEVTFGRERRQWREGKARFLTLICRREAYCAHVAASRPHVEQGGVSAGPRQDPGGARVDMGHCASPQSQRRERAGDSR